MNIYFNFEMKHFIRNDKSLEDDHLFKDSPSQDVFETIHSETYNIFEIENEFGKLIAKMFVEADILKK